MINDMDRPVNQTPVRRLKSSPYIEPPLRTAQLRKIPAEELARRQNNSESNQYSREPGRPTPSKPSRRRFIGRRIVAATAIVAAGTTAGAFIEAARDSNSVHVPSMNNPYRIYEVPNEGTTDGEGHGTYLRTSDIAGDALPQADTGKTSEMIKLEIGRTDVQSGDVLIFPANAELGTLVDPAQPVNSANTRHLISDYQAQEAALAQQHQAQPQQH